MSGISRFFGVQYGLITYSNSSETINLPMLHLFDGADELCHRLLGGGSDPGRMSQSSNPKKDFWSKKSVAVVSDGFSGFFNMKWKKIMKYSPCMATNGGLEGYSATPEISIEMEEDSCISHFQTPPIGQIPINFMVKPLCVHHVSL